MSKLGFSDLLKSGVTLNAGNIKENKLDLQQFVIQTRKEQVEVLKMKDLNDNQLKIVIKL